MLGGRGKSRESRGDGSCPASQKCKTKRHRRKEGSLSSLQNELGREGKGLPGEGQAGMVSSEAYACIKPTATCAWYVFKSSIFVAQVLFLQVPLCLKGEGMMMMERMQNVSPQQCRQLMNILIYIEAYRDRMRREMREERRAEEHKC